MRQIFVYSNTTEREKENALSLARVRSLARFFPFFIQILKSSWRGRPHLLRHHGGHSAVCLEIFFLFCSRFFVDVDERRRRLFRSCSFDGADTCRRCLFPRVCKRPPSERDHALNLVIYTPASVLLRKKQRITRNFQPFFLRPIWKEKKH